jgi:arylsulfatase A
VAAGATSWAITTTYDIFPTVLSLAGGELPTDRVFDGKDLTDVLLTGAASPHACVFHWYDSAMTKDGEGLSAVRCGEMKAHFYTQGDYGHFANRSIVWPTGKQDPPLLFNLSADPSETSNVDSQSAAYTTALATIRAARDAHLATIVPVCSQDKGAAQGGCGGNDIKLAVCGDENSKAKYPQWPKCTITPANWDAKSCV